MTDGHVIEDEHIWEVCMTSSREAARGEAQQDEILPLAEMERRYLTRVVRQYQGDRKSLARQLGISERTLFRKLKTLHLVRELEAESD